MNVISAGRTLYLADPSGVHPHLWLILTDPAGSPPEVVIVMVRTPKAFTDETLLLDPGDHPFVRHRSCVQYSTAVVRRVGAITAQATAGRCTLREDMTRELLARARAGLRDSPFTVNAVKKYCEKKW